MIVRMTRLYIRLVTYAKLHIMTSVVLLVFYLHAYSCYCYSVVCLSCYLVILCLQFILLLFCAHCLYARAVLFTHTLTRSLSDDLNLHVQILDALFLLSGVRWDYTYCDELESLSDSGILISLIFLLFSDSTFIAFSCHFLSFIQLLSLC